MFKPTYAEASAGRRSERRGIAANAALACLSVGFENLFHFKQIVLE